MLLKELKVTDDERTEIERKTIGQLENKKWIKERKSRLTASNFGRVCKLKPTTSRAKLVEKILYHSLAKGNEHTRYGLANEKPARKDIQTRLKKTIRLSGLFIHRTLNYLAANPDGLIGEDSILEVTCPSSIKKYTPEEAFNRGKLKYMVKNKRGKLVLKRNHVFYYQVQGQLNISEKKFCYFVVWTPKGFIIDKIRRNKSFWNKKIKPYVKEFYMKSLLPEIIDPRFKRKLPIRTGISNEAV